MMRRFCLLLLAVSLYVEAAEPPEATIRKIFESQTQAWNRGDFKSYTELYAEDALFVNRTPIRTRSKIFEMYRNAYPTPERRGNLAFTVQEIRMLGRDYASVVGRYRLTHAVKREQDAEGVFSLLLHAGPQGWQIILDHTS
jgi:uncharacterized protein (TIGR02246 family)